MNKETLLKSIKKSISTKFLKRKGVDALFKEAGSTESVNQESLLNRYLTIPKMLSYTGISIIFLGTILFTYQHWFSLGSWQRVILTIGTSAICYILSIVCSKTTRAVFLTEVFFLLFSLIFPVGLLILFQALGYPISKMLVHLISAFLVFLSMLCSYLILRKNLVIAIIIFSGTWLYILFNNYLAGNYHTPIIFTKYEVLAIGLIYMLIGYYFLLVKNTNLLKFFYGLGFFLFLGSALLLGGLAPHRNVFWEALFPVLTSLVIVFSFYIKNKTFLEFGFIFLVSFIFKIAAEFFILGSSPVLLLLLSGLLLLITGLFFFYIKEKYLQKYLSGDSSQ